LAAARRQFGISEAAVELTSPAPRGGRERDGAARRRKPALRTNRLPVVCDRRILPITHVIRQARNKPETGRIT